LAQIYGNFSNFCDGTRCAYASDIMFETIRLPGLRSRSNREPSTQFGVRETGGRRLTTGIAIGAAAAAVAFLLATRAPAPELHTSAQALLPAAEVGAPGRYEAACGRGDSHACNTLGVLYRAGREVPQDPFTAVAFFSNACGAGDADGCNNLGVMQEEGAGIPRDLSAAREAYERACDAGSGLGCSNLGALYHFGRGVALDEERARTLFEQACAAGAEIGCENLESRPTK
jgi:TPR repeat protein